MLSKFLCMAFILTSVSHAHAQSVTYDRAFDCMAELSANKIALVSVREHGLDIPYSRISEIDKAIELYSNKISKMGYLDSIRKSKSIFESVVVRKSTGLIKYGESNGVHKAIDLSTSRSAECLREAGI